MAVLEVPRHARNRGKVLEVPPLYVRVRGRQLHGDLVHKVPEWTVVLGAETSSAAIGPGTTARSSIRALLVRSVHTPEQNGSIFGVQCDL